MSGGFFALGAASPIGTTPTFVLLALVLAGGVTWLFARRQVRGLPKEVARESTRRRAIGAALLTGGATYFVLMQFIIPVLFMTGVLSMGQYFMH